MGRIKGSLLVGVVKRAHREPGVLRRLDPEDRRYLESERVLESSWYPLDTCMRLVAAIEACVRGRNDGVLAREFGRLTAEVQLSGTYSPFFMEGDPGRQLERMPALWRMLFDDGDWSLEAVAINRYRCRYAGSSDRSGILPHVIEGLFEAALRMAGARKPVLQRTPDAVESAWTWELAFEPPEAPSQ